MDPDLGKFLTIIEPLRSTNVRQVALHGGFDRLSDC